MLPTGIPDDLRIRWEAARTRYNRTVENHRRAQNDLARAEDALSLIVDEVESLLVSEWERRRPAEK